MIPFLLIVARPADHTGRQHPSHSRRSTQRPTITVLRFGHRHHEAAGPSLSAASAPLREELPRRAGERWQRQRRRRRRSRTTRETAVRDNAVGSLQHVQLGLRRRSAHTTAQLSERGGGAAAWLHQGPDAQRGLRWQAGALRCGCGRGRRWRRWRRRRRR